MYHLFFSLDTLLAAARATGTSLLLQTQRRTLSTLPVPLVETSILLTGPVPLDDSVFGGPTILAARLPVEQTQLWDLAGDQADHEALVRNVETAMTLLTARLSADDIPYIVNGGVSAEAGLLEDLRNSPADQDLWHIESGDQPDPRPRRLVPHPA